MKIIKTISLTCIISFMLTMVSLAADWGQLTDGTWYWVDKENGGTWYATSDWKDHWFRRDDGTYPIGDHIKGDRRWYLLDHEGYGMRGGEYVSAEDIYPDYYVFNKWYQKNDSWYRTDLKGTTLNNSWFQDADGKWYYLGSDGAMLTDTTTPDGYYVGPDGVWVQ